MIRESRLRVLSYLANEFERRVPVSTLANRLGWSTEHASRVVSEPRARECARTEYTGRQKLVARTEIEPIEQLEALTTEYSHVDLPGLVAGAGFNYSTTTNGI